MRNRSISKMNQSMDLAVVEEEESNNCLKPDDMPLTSTPLKRNDRRSVSLSDISEIGSNLEITKAHCSSDTLGSSSSICKDSGYNHSESSLSSDKVKESNPFTENYRDKYFRLLEDSKFMDVMITSLYESNYSLRMKIADAENKIFELRLKSESHCKCCANKSSDTSIDSSSRDSTNYQYKYKVSPLTKSEPCLQLSPPSKYESKNSSIKGFPEDESSTLFSKNTFVKAKQWQKTHKECPKNLDSNILPKMPSPPIEPSKIFIRPVPEPLPNPMSYMETSRALAETYRRRQEKSPDLFSVQLIGDHSVSVSPVQIIQGFHGANGSVKYLNELEKNKSDTLQESRKGIQEDSSLKQSLLGNIFLKNQKSNSLSDCLNKAQEYAASLTIGLSKLPSSLDENRSLSAQMK